MPVGQTGDGSCRRAAREAPPRRVRPRVSPQRRARAALLRGCPGRRSAGARGAAAQQLRCSATAAARSPRSSARCTAAAGPAGRGRRSAAGRGQRPARRADARSRGPADRRDGARHRRRPGPGRQLDRQPGHVAARRSGGRYAGDAEGGERCAGGPTRSKRSGGRQSVDVCPTQAGKRQQRLDTAEVRPTLPRIWRSRGASKIRSGAMSCLRPSAGSTSSTVTPSWRRISRTSCARCRRPRSSMRDGSVTRSGSTSATLGRAADVLLSVRLSAEESRLLSALAERATGAIRRRRCSRLFATPSAAAGRVHRRGRRGLQSDLWPPLPRHH